MRNLAVFLALGLCVAAPAAVAQELGRLFLTPEQRATLDARRKARVPDKPAAVAVVVAPVTRVDGFVQRTDGKSTIWVNGEATREGSRAGGANVQPSRPGGASVAIGAPEEARKAELRVGQSVDSVTGEVRDPLGDGAVKVRRAAEKAEARK